MPVVYYRGPGGQEVERRFNGELTVGRDPTNDVVLSHEPAASRNHARIARDGDRYVLTDAGSRNGTTVERGGQLIQVEGGCAVEDGDVIRIGVLALRFAADALEEPGATRMFDAHATQVEAETHLGAIAVPPIAPASPPPAGEGSRLTAGIVALIAAAVTVGAAVALVLLL